MTTETKHTPTLRARPAEWLGDQSPRYEAKIFDENGVFHSLVVAFSEDEANDRAAFIVRAVNAHEELLAALKMALEAEESLAAQVSRADRIRIMKQAITKATEGR